ncbi:MAG: hypothetical protein CME88_13810 [Hirschia sp.]|nr:hypothetical protein [Hirschia sp.]MBF19448.1 hypothetical protein [Hirschia sp.]
MTQTPRLSIDYMAAGQAQKHVTYNEALGRLDGIVSARIRSRGVVSPPVDMEEGEAWLLTAPGEEGWVGHDDTLLQWRDSAWQVIAPFDGLRLWVADEGVLIARESGDWTVIGAEPSGADTWGVNTVADTTNRLAVSSEAVLFTHAGNDQRLTLNKADEADTASLVFQSDFEGLAEMGLTGDQLFRVKVRPSGGDWSEAITVDADAGRVGIFSATPKTPLHVQAGEGDVLRLEPARLNGSATTQRSGVDFFASFDGYPNDQKPRRAAFMTVGFNSGVWGKEYMAFCVGGSNDSGVEPTERMRINGAGRVGIGTQAPSTQLHVDGGVRVGQRQMADLSSAASVGAGTLIYVTDATGSPCLVISNGTDWLRLETSGVVQ